MEATALRFLLSFALLALAAGPSAYGQKAAPDSSPFAFLESAQPSELELLTMEAGYPPVQSGTTATPAAAPQAATPQAATPQAAADTKQPASTEPKAQAPVAAGQQPKRILGIMPNFRAVSAGTIPPPPTAKQAFMIATKNSFDYSSFIFVGMTSALAEWTNAHPQLGQGMAGYGQYYWRGFLDKTNGNYLVIFAFPTILHQDERYYAMGTGGFWKRAFYAATRVAVAKNYEGENVFNASEVIGRGTAQAISLSYYPSQTRTLGGFASKYAYAIGRDALTNTFREFWPDIAVHILHRQP
jgi:hypothetical protein